MFRLRYIFLAVPFLTGVLLLDSSPAEAKTPHKKHHHARHTTHHAHHHVATKSHARNDVRTAQTHLIHLHYLHSKADGKLGPKTVAAIRHFQHDQHLPVTGKLTTSTYNALVEADMPFAGPTTSATTAAAADFYAKHPDFYGHYDQQYANPMIGAPAVVSSDNATTSRTQTLPTRFGKIDMSEENAGAQKRYNVTLNDQPILTVGDQPSVIGVSSTYDLGAEDAIIFTTYHSESGTCPYKHYLLTLKADTNNLQEIANCTSGYQAKVNNGSLFVEFPEADDARAVGNTWRYENGHLERL